MLFPSQNLVSESRKLLVGGSFQLQTLTTKPSQLHTKKFDSCKNLVDSTATQLGLTMSGCSYIRVSIKLSVCPGASPDRFADPWVLAGPDLVFARSRDAQHDTRCSLCSRITSSSLLESSRFPRGVFPRMPIPVQGKIERELSRRIDRSKVTDVAAEGGFPDPMSSGAEALREVMRRADEQGRAYMYEERRKVVQQPEVMR